MRNRHEPRGLTARILHPLLVLLIAAGTAVAAIAQCGLLLDAAAAEQGAAGATAALTGSDMASRPAEPPRVAAAPGVAPSPDAARTN